MSNIWFASDHHFGHKNIIKFTGPNGDPARSIFESIEEHNEALVENHNAVVDKNDRVYLLGDVCWNSAAIKYLKALKGNKVLVMGNHDQQKVTSYLGSVNSVKGAMTLQKPKHGISAILTHIPVHPCQLEYRFNCNIHGHMHSFNINDPKYINVSMEQINYTPISLDELAIKLKETTYE